MNIRSYINELVGKYFIDSETKKAYRINTAVQIHNKNEFRKADNKPFESLALDVTYEDNKKSILRLEDHLDDKEDIRRRSI
jgi:hypothetical protein